MAKSVQQLEKELATIKEELATTIKDRDEHKEELATTKEENATLKEEVLRLSGEIESRDKYIDTLETNEDNKKPKDGEVEVIIFCAWGEHTPNSKVIMSQENAQGLINSGRAEYV